MAESGLRDRIGTTSMRASGPIDVKVNFFIWIMFEFTVKHISEVIKNWSEGVLLFLWKVSTVLSDCLNVDRSIISGQFFWIWLKYIVKSKRSLGDCVGNQKDQFHQGAIAELICVDLWSWLEKSALELTKSSFSWCWYQNQEWFENGEGHCVWGLCHTGKRRWRHELVVQGGQCPDKFQVAACHED